MKTDYEKQAEDFLKATGATMTIEFSHNGKHFANDKEPRDIYNVTIERGQRKMTVKFGNSIEDSGFYASYGRTTYPLPYKKINLSDAELVRYVKSHHQHDFGNVRRDAIHRPKAPTAYDVLTCLQKNDVGTFEDFCSEFGFDTDSRRAETTYKAVVDEFKNLCALFSDSEIEQLQEIQ
jgi:hypothetical protein